MDRKYYTGDQILDALSEVGVGAGDTSEVLSYLGRLPSAEPEIIHCRDCKYYDGRPCGIVDWYNTDSDFCSRAERRTDE